MPLPVLDSETQNKKINADAENQIESGRGRGKTTDTLIRTYRLPSNSKINTVTLLKVACSAIGAQREPRHS